MIYALITSVIVSIIIYTLINTNKQKKHVKKEYEFFHHKATIAHEAIQKLNHIKSTESLYELLNLHKSLCNDLQLNSSTALGPCNYGYFRTKDIANMTAEEVFLGDIYGLWTKSLHEWASCDSTMKGNGWGLDPNTKCVSLIFKQYYNILYTGLVDIKRESTKEMAKLISKS